MQVQNTPEHNLLHKTISKWLIHKWSFNIQMRMNVFNCYQQDALIVYIFSTILVEVVNALHPHWILFIKVLCCSKITALKFYEAGTLTCTALWNVQAITPFYF